MALADVKPGAMWNEDVYIDDRNLLVPARIPVRQKDLDMLHRWGVTFVMTDGEPVVETPKSPGRDDPSSVAFAGSRKLYRQYTDLVDALALIFDLIAKGEQVDSHAIEKMTQSVLQLVRDERDESISAILGSAIKEDSLARSGINISILSVVIGQTLRLPPYRLAYLATGALLHDVGMLRIPEEIRKKKGKLSEEEAHKIRAH
ncbi:MAG TPA: hypothetical protein VMV44_11210, partial [Rectinemataceae bacterium]|nr:hypothetical protein [Rectinemataceae bacterium]